MELLELAVDDAKVTPTPVAIPGKWDTYQDPCHYYNIPEPTPGRHTATATIRVLATKTESRHIIEFTV